MHAGRQREGALDGDTLHAMLRLRDGKWTVVAFIIGPTEVGWMDWQEDVSGARGLIPQAGRGAR